MIYCDPVQILINIDFGTNMPSDFYKKILTLYFKDRILNLLEEIKNRRIILYGKKSELKFFYKNFDLSKHNIVAIANKEWLFRKTLFGKKVISTKNIKAETFDNILVISESFKPEVYYLTTYLGIEKNVIKTAIQDEIEDECYSFAYVKQKKIERRIELIKKQLKDKRIILYGAGVFLETILKYYNLSGLNIIGIADRRFTVHDDNELFYGYKVFAPEEITKENPDCLIMSTRSYLIILYDVYQKYLKNTGIKILPLVKKTFWELLREI